MQLNRTTLKNGLRVIHFENSSTQKVTVNVFYRVGSAYENPDLTGLAHLVEHLHFGGTLRVHSYDNVVQRCGGVNNAWTTADETNYYCTVPKQNAEVAFFLEADRMKGINYNQEYLEVERKVVMEEFKERYRNKPYGDSRALLLNMVFSKSPYKWQTIGKDLAHIERIQLKDVINFTDQYYQPSNAVLSVAGNISWEETLRFAENYFANIPSIATPKFSYTKDSRQTAENFVSVTRDVPLDMYYRAYKINGRINGGNILPNLISDVLAEGASARLIQSLTKEQNIATRVDAYICDLMHEDVFVLNACPNEGVSLQQVSDAIDAELEKLNTELVSDYELNKVKNIVSAHKIYEQVDCATFSATLAEAEAYGIDYFSERDLYNSYTAEDVMHEATEIFTSSKACVLHYLKRT